MSLVRLLLALGIVLTSLFNRAGRLTLLYNTKEQVQHWTNIKTRNMPLPHLPFPDDIELQTAVFEYINKVCFYDPTRTCSSYCVPKRAAWWCVRHWKLASRVRSGCTSAVDR